MTFIERIASRIRSRIDHHRPSVRRRVAANLARTLTRAV